MLSTFVLCALLNSPTMLDFYGTSSIEIVQNSLQTAENNFRHATDVFDSMMDSLYAMNPEELLDTEQEAAIRDLEEAQRQCITFDIIIKIARECINYRLTYGNNEVIAYVHQHMQAMNWHALQYNKIAGG